MSTFTPLPFWHPESFARRAPMLAKRQRLIAALRGWFAGSDFAEVETPILQTSPGNEVHLHAFVTEFKSLQGEPSQKLYLHTSPEFTMKKLLVAGVPRLYQLARTFRNGERSSRHHPEFLMLEWYRANSELAAIKDDCVGLIRAMADAIDVRVIKTCDLSAPWESLTVCEAFKLYADIDLLATMQDVLHPDRGALAAQARDKGFRVMDHEQGGDTWEDIYFRILGEKIEPLLGQNVPTFLCDYPITQAALARPKLDDPLFAERFELYICGVELANAFGELSDADEQERRFAADMDAKERIYGDRYPIDADFIAALRHGMPPSAGIALGIDRLVMLCTGAEDITDVLWAPVAGAPI